MAITLPSRDSSVPLTGGWVRRVSFIPGERPGKTSSGRQVTWSPDTGTWTSPAIVPNRRVWISTGTLTAPPCSPVLWLTTTRVAVAVSAARR